MEKIEILAGDFKEGNGSSFSNKELILRDESSIPFFPVNDRISMSEIEEISVASEENVKKIWGTVGWGLLGGLTFGVGGVAAGLLAGGKKKRIIFICKLKDGRKFMGKTSSKAYTKLMAANFNC